MEMQSLLDRINKRHLKIIAIIVVVVWVGFEGRALDRSVRLNLISLGTVRWFLLNNITVTDIGLRLEYGEPVASGFLENYALLGKCEVSSPRLALRTGIIQMLTGNLDTASRCFSISLASRPEALDATILQMSVYHLTGQKVMSRNAFESLPGNVQVVSSVAAQAIFDYVAINQAGPQTKSWLDQFGGSAPRRILFDLMSSDLRLAEGFLNKAVQFGLLSSVDRSDFLSVSGWWTRQRNLANQWPSLSSNDQQYSPELRQAVAASLGCTEQGFELGPNLLPEGLFDRPQNLDKWYNLPWTYSGSEDYNQGRFLVGLDIIPDGDSNVGALRISGLWKTEDPQRDPASGALELSRPLQLLKGHDLYLVLVRYRTENIRSGQPAIWFDAKDYQRFFGVWQLEPSDGVWEEVYALGNVEGDTAPRLLISQYALGTVWIRYLQVIPVYLKGCSLGNRTILFGKTRIPGQE